MAQQVKNSPEMQEVHVWSVGQEDPLEEGMATHSCILAGKIPEMVPSGLWFLVGYGSWDHKELDMTKATEHM